MSDVDKTKEAILEIFKRDDTTAPEALFLMSVLSARMLVNSCVSPKELQFRTQSYFNEVMEAIGVTGECKCPKCRQTMN